MASDSKPMRLTVSFGPRGVSGKSNVPLLLDTSTISVSHYCQYFSNGRQNPDGIRSVIVYRTNEASGALTVAE